MMSMVRELIKKGQEMLSCAGVADAAFDSKALLSFILDIPFSRLMLHYGDEVSEESSAEFFQVIERRASHVPLQYITHEQEFMGLSFYVDERVLIPRLDIEILVEEALKYIKEEMHNQSPEKSSFRVLDLCCGSGAIGLSVAVLANESSASQVEVVLTDISEDALEVTKKNAEALGVLDKVKIFRGDLFEALDSDQCFDLILSNPPYIESEVIGTLDSEVKDYEPMLALDGGKDGLDIYRRILSEAGKYLTDKGCLMMEIGADQAEAVSAMCEGMSAATHKDLAGLDRVVVVKN